MFDIKDNAHLTCDVEFCPRAYRYYNKFSVKYILKKIFDNKSSVYYKGGKSLPFRFSNWSDKKFKNMLSKLFRYLCFKIYRN